MIETAVTIEVSLDVHSFDCEFEEISRILGITPSRVWRKGEHIPRTIMTHKRNRWIVDAPAFDSNVLGDHIAALFARVVEAVPRFSGLPAEAIVQVYCVVYDHNRVVTLSIPKDVVEQAASIGAEINMDYYCTYDPD